MTGSALGSSVSSPHRSLSVEKIASVCLPTLTLVSSPCCRVAALSRVGFLVAKKVAEVVSETAQARQVRRVNEAVIRQVRAVEHCVVPPRNKAIIPGRLNPGGKIGLIRLLHNLSDPTAEGLMVGRAVISADSSHSLVRVVNITDQPRSIKAEQVIAGAQDIDRVLDNDVEYEPYNADLLLHLQEQHTRVVEEASLRPTVARKFASLLSKLQGVFAKDNNNLRQTDVVEHHIDTCNARSILQPPCRLGLFNKKECEKEVQKMLKRGFIDKGQSSWSSPVVLVRKKYNTFLFCVDCRRLNAVTKFNAFPLPRIDKTLEASGGALWFTTLDLLAGYWQVGLTPEARLKSPSAPDQGCICGE